MLSHLFIGVSDFERAYAFYSALMHALGIEQRFCDPDRPWAGWHCAEKARPFLVIGKPFDGAPHAPGNGQMVALLAANRALVDNAYAVALANGGSCEGAPGLRLEYHENYYGAYFRDPDGNKLCVACHAPEAAEQASAKRGEALLAALSAFDDQDRAALAVAQDAGRS